MGNGKSGCGCFGCVILLIVSGVVLGILSFAGWQVYQGALAFTTPKSEPLPRVVADERQFRELIRRMETFAGAGAEGELRLNAGDLNQYVHGAPEFAYARDHVYFSIEKGIVYSDVSLQLKSVPFLSERWLRGRVGLDLSMENRQSRILVKSLQARGEAAPSAFMDMVARQDFGPVIERSPEVAKTLKGVKSIAVEDDVIILKK